MALDVSAQRCGDLQTQEGLPWNHFKCSALPPWRLELAE